MNDTGQPSESARSAMAANLTDCLSRTRSPLFLRTLPASAARRSRTCHPWTRPAAGSAPPARTHPAGRPGVSRTPRPLVPLSVGSPGGISPPGSHGSEREPLGSLRSSHLKPLESARPLPVREHGPVPGEQVVPPSFRALERAQPPVFLPRPAHQVALDALEEGLKRGRGEPAVVGHPASRFIRLVPLSCQVVALKIDREQMLRVLHDEHLFSAFFLNFMLLRGMRTQADLIDQLFNSSERRLARTLLLMAESGEPGEPETLIPPITQETLAEMIGTTRSRVSFFMNRFRKLGYIDYNGRIRVNRSLLTVVLHDQLPEENASRAQLLDPHASSALTAQRAKRV